MKKVFVFTLGLLAVVPFLRSMGADTIRDINSITYDNTIADISYSDSISLGQAKAQLAIQFGQKLNTIVSQNPAKQEHVRNVLRDNQEKVYKLDPRVWNFYELAEAQIYWQKSFLKTKNDEIFTYRNRDYPSIQKDILISDDTSLLRKDPANDPSDPTHDSELKNLLDTCVQHLTYNTSYDIVQGLLNGKSLLENCADRYQGGQQNEAIPENSDFITSFKGYYFVANGRYPNIHAYKEMAQATDSQGIVTEKTPEDETGINVKFDYYLRLSFNNRLVKEGVLTKNIACVTYTTEASDDVLNKCDTVYSVK